MQLPDTRSQYKTSLYANTKGASAFPEDNPYWQAYLSEIDARDVSGYDWAVSEAESFFSNMEMFAKEFAAAGLNPDELQPELFSEEKSIAAYSDEELAKMTLTTKVSKAFAEGLFQWLESSRDALIVSLIDAMPETEYNELVRKVKSGEYKNVIMRTEKTN